MYARLMLAFALAIGLSPVAAQDNYPTKVVRIVTAAAGGGGDVFARLLSVGFTNSFGQQFIVDNRGAIALELVAKAPPDGYTLLISGSPLWLLPLIRPSAPWDALRDYAPISLATAAPSILVVHPSVPVKTPAELIALARARPGGLNYAAGTLGATPHLAAELFKSLTKTNIVQVAYKGTGPGIIGTMAGEVDLMFPNAGSVMPHVRSGRLRGIAVCSAKPSPLAPGLPPLADTVPGFETISPQGLFAPARTPPAIINRLQQELVRTLGSTDSREKIAAMGVEIVGSTPAEFTARIKSDIARMDPVIRAAGLREK